MTPVFVQNCERERMLQLTSQAATDVLCLLRMCERPREVTVFRWTAQNILRILCLYTRIKSPRASLAEIAKSLPNPIYRFLDRCW